MSASPDPSAHIHLAVALDGTGWHPAVLARARRPPRRAVDPPILDRPGQRSRTGPAGLRHHRRRPHPAVRRPPAGRRANRPRPRPTGRRTDRLPGGTPHQPHRAHSHGDHHAHRTLPSVEGHRHARLRQLRSGRNPGAGVGDAAPDAAGGISGRRRVSPTATVCLRRGRRLRRSAASAVGQLGGRRGDSRRRDWPVRRPKQAALHRLRRRLVLRQGSVHHAEAAAGTADRRRARPRRGRPPADRGQRRRRVRHPAQRPRHHGIVDAISSHRATGAAPVRVFADLVVFLDETATAAAARRNRLDDAAGANTSATQRFSSARPRLADLLQEWHAAGAAGFRLRPATLPHDLRQITDGLVPELRGVERSATPTRPPRCGARSISRVPPTATRPPATRNAHEQASQADSPRRALPGRQQHHGVERSRLRQPHRVRARSSTSPKPPNAASSTSCSWPRVCACASRAARSTTSTWSAGRTRSRCWPRWPPSPTDSG